MSQSMVSIGATTSIDFKKKKKERQKVKNKKKKKTQKNSTRKNLETVFAANVSAAKKGAKNELQL